MIKKTIINGLKNHKFVFKYKKSMNFYFVVKKL